MPDDHSITSLLIADIEIFQDALGRYSLNCLQKASEAAAKPAKAPAQWLRRKTTQALITTLQNQNETPILEVIQGGKHPGVYTAQKSLIFAYYEWLKSHRIPKKDGFLYVIEYTKAFPVKIGITDTPHQRLKRMQYSSPVPLCFRYLWYVADKKTCELFLYQKLSLKKSHGEWFVLSPQDEMFLRQYMNTFGKDQKVA